MFDQVFPKLSGLICGTLLAIVLLTWGLSIPEPKALALLVVALAAGWQSVSTNPKWSVICWIVSILFFALSFLALLLRSF